MELSHFGAKVIYPPSLQPAFKQQIPIYIKNTFNPTCKGTLISKEIEQTSDTNEAEIVKGISSIDSIALLKFQGLAMLGMAGISSRVFRCLADNQINVILITQASSERSISIAVMPNQAEQAKKALEKAFEFEISTGKVDEVLIENNLSIIAAVGENMRQMPGVAAKFFNALGKNGVNIRAIAQGSSELNISVVIEAKNLKKGLNVAHEAFFRSRSKPLNLFMIGVGLIGKTLIEQISSQLKVLETKQNLELRFVGLANSKKMLFDEKGIDLSNWEQQLSEATQANDLNGFVQQAIDMNLRNSIFIDCTANEAVANIYQPLLANSISITTPNKIANSGELTYYQELKKTAKQYNAKYLYETNVGAGLPVINTLNSLVHSGDKIIKIEGILSGTLSYIFNTYDGSTPFSQVVKAAKEQGFTEPDPRNDLNGKDVARKILILARESGYAVEPDSVEVESLVSAKRR